MKKEANEKRILRFLLEQQFPEALVGSSSVVGSTTAAAAAAAAIGVGLPPNINGGEQGFLPVTIVDHVNQVSLEACRCIHLQEYLPHLLSLELCKATTGQQLSTKQLIRRWIFANPIHALHMASQLDEINSTSTSSTSTMSFMDHEILPPIFYGDEQQRTMMLNAEGIAEYWSPLSGYSSSSAIPQEGNRKKISTKRIPTIVPSQSTTTTTTASAAAAIAAAAALVKKPPPPSLIPSILIKTPTAPNNNNSSSATTIPVGQTLSDSVIMTATTLDHPPTKDDASKPITISTIKSDDNADKRAPEEEVVSGSTTTITVGQTKDVPISKEKPSELGGDSHVPKSDTNNQDVVSKDPSEINQDLPKEGSTVPQQPLNDPETVSSDSHTEQLVQQEETSKAVSTKPEEVSSGLVDDDTNKSKPTDSSLSNDKARDEDGKTLQSPMPPKVVSSSDDIEMTDGTKPLQDMMMEVSSAGDTKRIDQEAPMGASPPAPVLSSILEPPPPVLSTSSEKKTTFSVPVPVPSVSSFVGTTQVTPLELPESTYNRLRNEEDRIRQVRRSLAAGRMAPKKKVEAEKTTNSKKKRKRDDTHKSPSIPGLNGSSTAKELTKSQFDQWLEAQDTVNTIVERWLERFRSCRQSFWDDRKGQLFRSGGDQGGSFYLPQENRNSNTVQMYSSGTQGSDRYSDGKAKKAGKPKKPLMGDDVMQCLDCGFIGSKQDVLKHLLISGHKFAVTCGEKCQLFSFCTGDFVYHEVFEQEKARIDYSNKLPAMAWGAHKLYRSFDPLHFMKTKEQGIVWRGLVATYPQLVPKVHLRATEATCRRQALFDGDVDENWLMNSPVAMTFAATQALLAKSDRHLIKSPLGMYNLGNTCYKSSVLQCLVHCIPLQQFFLRDYGHHSHACKLYREWDFSGRRKKCGLDEPCLACDMDRLFLSYYGNTIGMDVRYAVDEACNVDKATLEQSQPLEKGEPLIISEMLTASWKSGGMNSVASYKQHDAHEFLNSFLELLGKQTRQHWDRIHDALNVVQTNASKVEPTRKGT